MKSEKRENSENLSELLPFDYSELVLPENKPVKIELLFLDKNIGPWDI